MEATRTLVILECPVDNKKFKVFLSEDEESAHLMQYDGEKYNHISDIKRGRRKQFYKNDKTWLTDIAVQGERLAYEHCACEQKSFDIISKDPDVRTMGD